MWAKTFQQKFLTKIPEKSKKEKKEKNCYKSH